VLRRLLWTGLYAGLGTIAAIATRRVAVQVWQVVTGEDPPVKRWK
jgi:hypothetical protein